MKEDMSLNRKLIGDVVRLGIDFFSGTFISVLAFSGWGGFTNPPAPLVAGVIGGVLPDALQFLFWKFRREPLISIQKFHSFMHADWEFGYKSKFGVVLQVVLAAIIIFISRTIIR